MSLFVQVSLGQKCILICAVFWTGWEDNYAESNRLKHTIQDQSTNINVSLKTKKNTKYWKNQKMGNGMIILCIVPEETV